MKLDILIPDIKSRSKVTMYFAFFVDEDFPPNVDKEDFFHKKLLKEYYGQEIYELLLAANYKFSENPEEWKGKEVPGEFFQSSKKRKYTCGFSISGQQSKLMKIHAKMQDYLNSGHACLIYISGIDKKSFDEYCYCSMSSMIQSFKRHQI